MLNDNTSESRAQEREQAEPSEKSQPIPLLFLIGAAALVLWGAGYIVLSGSFGRADLGDRRTLADLSGPAPGASTAANGKQLFTANCAACHQASGKGLPGVFPPLDGSEWVAGDERTVANILLHGITGNAHDWDDIAPELARHYRVLALARKRNPMVVSFMN
jgi:mono/diheme cytochrome c family protein